MIESNIGYPIIIFYAASAIMLTILYRKKLKLFFALLYTLTVIAFNSSLWELPMMISGPMNQGGFFTGLIYFIPLPLFMIFYNVRFNYNIKKIFLMLFAIITSLLFGHFYPPSLYYQLGQYYSFGYLTTFIPRTISLVAISYLCIPNVNLARFNIGKLDWRHPK